MALKPTDMKSVTPKPDMEIVRRYEKEADEYLQKQDKGKSEYMISWAEYLEPVNLNKLVNIYNQAGWEAKGASHDYSATSESSLTVLTLIMPVYRGGKSVL